MLNSFFKYASGRWSNAIVSSSDPLPVEIIGGGYDLSTLIVEDSLGTKFIRRELINTEGIVTIGYEDFDGLSAVPVAPITIASTVLPVGASTSAKQDELRGTQGTGASYDPPTGGSGVFGWLSGTYKEIVSGIKLKLGGSDVSSSNPLPTSTINLFDTTPLECARGNMFVCRIVTTSLATGNFLSITLQNPTGSGEVLYLVGGHCNTSSAAVQQTYQRTIAPTGTDITGTLIKNANPSAGRTTQAKLWKDDLAAASTPAAAIWGKVATATSFAGGGLLYSNVFPVLAAGESLTMEHLTANLSGELVLVFISKPA